MSLISIAVDGPAGSGKSTVAKQVAKKLKITYLDTGAMYRAVTFHILQTKTDINDLEGIKELLLHTDLDFINDEIYLNGKNIDDAIRLPEINQNVSAVASILEVRKKLVNMQQKIAQNKSIVMDGRDIGTQVLPQATYKFFLTASIEERAKRRYLELKNKGIQVELSQIIEEIRLRDYDDSTRAISPLKKAADAHAIDTTKFSIEQVVDLIFEITESE